MIEAILEKHSREVAEWWGMSKLTRKKIWLGLKDLGLTDQKYSNFTCALTNKGHISLKTRLEVQLLLLKIITTWRKENLDLVEQEMRTIFEKGLEQVAEMEAIKEEKRQKKEEVEKARMARKREKRGRPRLSN